MARDRIQQRHAKHKREAYDSADTLKLAEVFSSITCGVSVNGEDRPAQRGEPGVLRLSAVNGGIFRPHENKAVLGDQRDRLGIKVAPGTILISRSNTLELVGAAALVEAEFPDLYLPDLLWQAEIRDHQKTDPKWLSYVLASDEVRTEIKARATGTSGSMKKLSMASFREIMVRRPLLGEQKAIAAVLSAWDRAISQTATLIAAKERLKQGLMQQLLTGQRRFPEFRRQKLRPAQLNAVLMKVVRAVSVDPSKSYREIGIRSHGKGIFHKDPVEGRSLGNKRVYEVVPGCLTLNIVFAWERALAVTSNDEAGMIASHRFPMFQPDPERIAIEFVLHYMLSDVGHNVLKLASPGGAGRNRTISQGQFLKTRIPLPSIAEQHKIVAFINTADGELRSLKMKLESLKKQKRGLMQQLLTGKVRVPKSLLKKGARS